MDVKISLKVCFQRFQTYNKPQFDSKLKLVGADLTTQLILSHCSWLPSITLKQV